MAERTTKVTLTAQVQGYIDGMEKASKATRETGSEAEKLAAQREAFNTIGTAATVAGAAMLAASVFAAKAAMDWESAWAGVTKTVDGTPQQMAAVEEGLRNLSYILPSTHEEIAAVAEAAGQLGVATPNVVAFTKTMIDLGETTNLSAEEAAMSLAQFMNIMGTSQTDISNLGSALVGLGNSYATTESDILAMSSRLSKSGVQIGLSEGEVMGLAASLSSVGIEAEAGGSAMSKVMIDIASSVEEGGDRLKQFADVSGMSSAEFAKQWKSDPGAALATFVSGLADAEAQGSSTLGVLADLGITEVRMRDALLGSAAAADDFSAAMEMGNEEFEKNNALAAEAAKRYETAESKVAMAGNAVKDAAINFGSVLAPMIGFASEKITSFSKGVASMPDELQGVIGALGGIGGAALTAGGLALLAIPQFAATKTALQTLGIQAQTTGRLMGAVGKGLMVGAAVVAFTMLFDVVKDVARELADIDNQTAELVTSNASLKDSVSALNMGQEISDYGAALDAMGAAQGNWFENLTVGFSQAKIDGAALSGTLGELGKQLGAQALTNLPAAQNAFRGYADEVGASEDQIMSMINAMPGYKDALVAQINATGEVADEATIMKYALGEAEGATQSLADEALMAEQDLQEFAQALDDIAFTAMMMGGSIDGAYSAINRLADAAKAEGANLYDTSDASIALRDAMRDVETTSRDAAEAMINNGESVDSAMAQWQVGRDQIIAMRMSMGESAEQATAWADTNLGTAASVKTALEGVAGAVNAIPKNPHITVTVDNSAAMTALGTVSNKIAEVLGAQQSMVYDFTKPKENATGGLYSGGVQAFAAGGFPSGIYPYTPGGIHKFAEAGDEAYLSFLPQYRARNVGIWQESGRRLGVGSGDFAGGGSKQIDVGGITVTTADPNAAVQLMQGQLGAAIARWSR